MGEKAFFLCFVVRPNASQCVHIVAPPGNVPTLATCVPLFLKAFTCSDKRLISCCCLATVSTEIARLAANSASGPTFATVCVTAAAILFKYPSSKSIILFVSGSGPAVVGFPPLRSCAFVVFSAAAPNIADPPKGFSSPSWAASERLFVTYASQKVVFHSVQVFWSSGIFYHSRVYVLYSPDWSSNFSATSCIYLS